MSRWEWRGDGGLRVRLCIPDGAERAHWENVEQRRAMALFDDLLEDEENELCLGVLSAVPELVESWVIDQADCDHVDCRCGPCSLLDVVDAHLPEKERQHAIEAHAAAMTEGFMHLWSGDALLGRDTPTVGDACSLCLTEGREHLSQLLGECLELATSFGETAAAFEISVRLGTSRFPGRPSGTLVERDDD